MTSSISKSKNDSQDRGAAFSGILMLIGLQWSVFLVAALYLWGLTAIDFLEYLAQIGASLFASGEKADHIGGVILLGTTLAWLVPVLLSMWALVSTYDAWRMKIEGYRNLLTIGFGQLIFTAIIMNTVSFVDGSIAFNLNTIGLVIASIVNIVLLMSAGHFKFYPEYQGMAITDLFRDLRFIRVFWQFFFVAVILFSAKFLVINVYNSLVTINAVPDVDFLYRRAGFAITQSPEWYSANSPFGHAFFVGLINTLRVVVVGLVLATLMGVLLGVFLLSQNWLIRVISRIYVEILRNTPLLVQLIFWYFVVWLSLPNTNLSFPDESVMVVALRYFVYLFAFIATIIYIWRFDSEPRFFSGMLTGFVIAELAIWLVNDSYFTLIVLAFIGAALLVMALQQMVIPKSFYGLAQGTGVMLVVILAGHAILDGLGGAGVVDNARFVYGEVMPLFILGPNLFATPRFGILWANFQWVVYLTGIALIIAVALYIYWGKVIERTGKKIPRVVYSAGIVLIALFIGWTIGVNVGVPADDFMVTVGDGEEIQELTLAEAREQELLEEYELEVYDAGVPVLVQPPTLNRFGTRVEVGNNISPNYIALLIGLVVYTSAFIGEIVRAGIQAVPWGQVEASRALGLSQAQTLRMIILPQALRVIIPPMGNQYLNLSKNSSLATAIAFSDTYQVGQTIMNQSGQSILGFGIILGIYLLFSLIISFFMNLVNSRFQIVTR